MQINTPWPPSVNHYWGIRVAGKRAIKYIGAKGKAFREEVKNNFKGESIDGKIKISVDAYPPDKRKRDIDNLLKAPLDALQHAGVYEDDNLIEEIHIKRCEVDKDNSRLEIRIEKC